jgi:hypothetical protein
MDDLLWLANHPLRGNVTSIPTSRNPDTPKGLESRSSIRILKELPHSTERELKKIRQIREDSGRASTLELLRGQAGKSSGPQNLTSLSTLQRMNLGTL